jgi:hypothetical protein
VLTEGWTIVKRHLETPQILRLLLEIACCAAIGALLIPPASAQGPTTGSIAGTVTDASGAVVTSSRVTVTSTALVVPQSTLTSSQGTYRFPALPPGDYTIAVEAVGFSVGQRAGINLTAGFSATIDMPLTLAGQVQTVAVTADSAVLDTENSKVQDTFGAEALNNLPTSRDMWSLIGVAPGLSLKAFDVGGSATGTQIAYTSYGFTGQQRVQMDGVNMTEATAATSAYTDYSAFEEVQMGTSSNDASMPSPGVQVNFIVKSGGNQFHGDFYQDYESSSFQGTNINHTQLFQGAGLGTRITGYHDTNGDLGGPIKKDKLWFFTSLRRQYIGTTITGYPVDNPSSGPPFATILSNGTYKLTYQINSKNKISQMLNFERKQQPFRNAGNNQYADAVYNQDLVEWIGNLEWSSTLSPNAYLNVRAGSWGYNWVNEAYANSVTKQIMPRRTDNTSGDVAGGFQPQGYFRRRVQLEPTLSYAAPHFLGLNHFFNFGFLYERETLGFNQYPYLDGYALTYASPAGAPDFTTPNQVTVYNSPTSTLDYVHHLGGFVQDKIKLNRRITLNLGLRWDYYNDYRPDQKISPNAPFTAFFYQGAALANGYSIPATYPNLVVPGVSSILQYPHAIAPRLGMAYDIFGNGRTTIKVSWGRFYNNPGIDISNNVNPIRQLSYTFKWNAPLNTVYFSPSQLGAFASSTGSALSPLDPHIRDPYLDDYSGYVEHQINRSWVVRSGFVYRKAAHSWVAVEQNRLTSLYTQPVTVTDPGPKGTGSTPLTVWDVPASTPLPASLTQIGTPDWNNSIYRNFEVTVTDRMSGKLSMSASFLGTWSTGFVDNTTGASVSQLSVTAVEPVQPNILMYNGYSIYNSNVHVFATYRAKWGIVISPIYRFQLGAPMQRVITVSGLRVGNVSVPTGPLGEYRGDNISIFDTRVEKHMTFHDRYVVGLFFDAFNISNSNAAQNQDNVTALKTITVNSQKVTYERFLSPTTIISPRIFRVGAKFTF